MGNAEISNLRPKDVSAPIKVRVVRKWSTTFRKNEICFIFVDD